MAVGAILLPPFSRVAVVLLLAVAAWLAWLTRGRGAMVGVPAGVAMAMAAIMGAVYVNQHGAKRSSTPWLSRCWWPSRDRPSAKPPGDIAQEDERGSTPTMAGVEVAMP